MHRRRCRSCSSCGLDEWGQPGGACTCGGARTPSPRPADLEQEDATDTDWWYSCGRPGSRTQKEKERDFAFADDSVAVLDFAGLDVSGELLQGTSKVLRIERSPSPLDPPSYDVAVQESKDSESPDSVLDIIIKAEPVSSAPSVKADAGRVCSFAGTAPNARKPEAASTSRADFQLINLL